MDDIEMKAKKQILRIESIYKPYATFNEDAIRLKAEENGIRMEFERDCDRIIHSLAYSRYIGKTQVYSEATNDHISKRMTHVQFVSRASRTIARALGLNEDLCEAISLGHDTGHTPFGHTGEKILNKISLKYLGENFMHNVQSVRNLMYIENKGHGLNLTLQVLDGIMCHNGEKVREKYEPMLRTQEEFLTLYNNLYKNSELLNEARPMTLEGCIVRISDIIGYVGKDIEDAIRLKKLNREDLPKEITRVLGDNNQSIMDTIITDIIVNSFEKDYISMSKQIYTALYNLKEFNAEKIYSKSHEGTHCEEYDKIFNELFKVYINALNKEKREYDIYKYVEEMEKEYIECNSNERIVIDFMAGMTDRYIFTQYNKYCK